MPAMWRSVWRIEIEFDFLPIYISSLLQPPSHPKIVSFVFYMYVYSPTFVCSVEGQLHATYTLGPGLIPLTAAQ